MYKKWSCKERVNVHLLVVVWHRCTCTVDEEIEMKAEPLSLFLLLLFLPQHKEPDCETIILLHATARMLCVEGRQYWCDTGNSHTNDRGRDKDGLQIDRKRLKISKRLPPPTRTRRNACMCVIVTLRGGESVKSTNG